MDSDPPAAGPVARGGMRPQVTLILRPEIGRIARGPLSQFVRRVSRALASPPQAVTVVLAADDEVRDLNRRYRGRDASTDVLSFPGEPEPDGGVSEGDIIISIDKARCQAAQRHHSLEVELRYLLIHGVLHLVGFDHETDGGEMEAEERRLRRLLLDSPTEGRRVAGRRAR